MTAPRILTCPACGVRHRGDLPGRFTCYRCAAVLETQRLFDRFTDKASSRWYIAPDGSATRLK